MEELAKNGITTILFQFVVIPGSVSLGYAAAATYYAGFKKHAFR